MTKLLEKAICKVRELPNVRQNDAAQILLAIARNDASRFEPTAEQLREMKISLKQAKEGKFASDKRVASMWRSFGV